MDANTITLSENRKPLADLLKGVAVLLMIQVHIVELFATQEFFESSPGRIALFLGGPPAAPVFMAVMGYFLAGSGRSTKHLVTRGINIFLGGLLLNIGLNLNLLISISQGRFDLNPWEYIFGADILTLAGLSIVLIALLRAAFKQLHPLAIMLLAVLTSYAGTLPVFGTPETPVLMYLNAFLWGNYSWSYFPLFPWLAYPLVGYAFRLLSERTTGITAMPYRVELILLIALGTGFIFTAEYAAGIAATLSVYYHHSTAFFAWTVCFLTGWTILFSIIQRRLSSTLPLRYLRWLGRHVTAAYVFQWLLIGNIATEIYRSQPPASTGAWFLLIVIATSVLVWGWNAMRLQWFRSSGSTW